MKHKFQNPLLAHIAKQLIAQDIALQERPDSITVEQFAREVGVGLDLPTVQKLRALAVKLADRAGLPHDDQYQPREILATAFRSHLCNT